MRKCRPMEKRRTALHMGTYEKIKSRKMKAFLFSVHEKKNMSVTFRCA